MLGALSLNASAQIDFVDHVIINNSFRLYGPRDAHGADIDGDGDLDVISASISDDKIVWYENLDGQGNFGNQNVISSSADYAQSVYPSDIDGDGDLDVLSASSFDNKIAWYENTDGQGSFGPELIISLNANFALSVYSIDIDGDGDMDVLSASSNDNKIAWYKNIDGQGSFSGQLIISTSALGAQTVHATDIDGDGDFDVVSGSGLDDRVAWYENMDGQGNFGAQQIISNNADFVTSVYTSDIDGDGDFDVLSSSGRDDKIAWYENMDGQGTFGVQQTITTDADSAQSVYASDIDGDGDMDVLSASLNDNKLAWYENTDGLGNFGSQQTITSNQDAYSIFAGDLDGDGDFDALYANQGGGWIAWYENADGLGNFGAQHKITTFIDDPTSVYSSDLDGDGDMDVLSASYDDDKIAWYENLDGQGNFEAQQIISTNADKAVSVLSADVDGDGDLDVLMGSEGGGFLAWHENTNGQGDFGPQQLIPTNSPLTRSVYATDLDGDGDLDVISGAYNVVSWNENTDGLGSFGDKQIISSNVDHTYAVFSSDIDGDGDMDVLSASSNDNKVAWYENLDGQGNFGEQQLVSLEEGARAIYAADIDGDGDMDIVSGGSGSGFGQDRLAWHENTDGEGSYVRHEISTNDAAWIRSIISRDLDGDGDLDLLLAHDSLISWFENTSGHGDFGSQQNISYAGAARSVYVADIDGDNDIDVLSASSFDNKIAWYENVDFLGIDQNIRLIFSIFPNPTSDIISINSFTKVVEIKIYNTMGQLVKSNRDKAEIDLSGIAQGFYYVKIKDENGTYGVKKVLKN